MIQRQNGPSSWKGGPNLTSGPHEGGFSPASRGREICGWRGACREDAVGKKAENYLTTKRGTLASRTIGRDSWNENTGGS